MCHDITGYGHADLALSLCISRLRRISGDLPCFPNLSSNRQSSITPTASRHGHSLFPLKNSVSYT
jgi:hypothetical protein